MIFLKWMGLISILQFSVYFVFNDAYLAIIPGCLMVGSPLVLSGLYWLLSRIKFKNPMLAPAVSMLCVMLMFSGTMWFCYLQWGIIFLVKALFNLIAIIVALRWFWKRESLRFMRKEVGEL